MAGLPDRSTGTEIASAPMAEIKKVGVLGAGLMGHAIAQVSATAGYDVVLREVDDERLGKGLGNIEKQLARILNISVASARRWRLLRQGSRCRRACRKRTEGGVG